MKNKTNKGKKYGKPISLYPLTFEQVLRLFMTIDDEKFKGKSCMDSNSHTS